MNDYRYNPFENVSTAITITGETHVIPSVSPYTIRLNEVPLKETPSSISLTIAGSAGAEVSAAPASGEFWPDYSTKADNDDSWNTGTILFNAADAGKTVVVSYVGTGTLVDTRTTHGQAVFTSSGVWICPKGITQVFITMCGGGGGGGGTNSQTIGSPGGNGGITYFGLLLSASRGGGGGGNGASNRGKGGSSGGSGGTNGGDGFITTSGSMALSGKGGDTLLGAGGACISETSAGQNGAGFGAGGSGGAYANNSNNSEGASGGGGGAQAYLKQALTVAPEAKYTITIGAGGTGGSANYPGGNGAPGICIIEW